MTIDYHDVFPILAEAMPDFKPSSADWEDRLSHVFLSDMVRFVCDRSYPGFPEYEILMRQFAELLERLIFEGDPNVHDLAHDALDSIWKHEERDELSKHFGPKTQEMWKLICCGMHGQ